MTEYLMVGEVLKPQGLRGECKIKPCAADLAMFETWKTLYLLKDGAYAAVPFRLSRIHEGFVYATLGSCAAPEDVERFRGARLYVDRAHATPLDDGAFYIADLIGCEAVDETGRSLGVLKDVLQNGPVDTWVFSGDRPFMAPALLRVFPRVDPAAGKIFAQSDQLNEVAVFED